MPTILVIDDNPDMVAMQQMLLTRAGHHVVTAGNGKEALLCVARQTFDLVITDIIMPDMEGLETIMAMRKQIPGTPIIAVSGGGHGRANDYLNFAKTLGAKLTLTKPFTGKELVAAVQQVLQSASPAAEPTAS